MRYHWASGLINISSGLRGHDSSEPEPRPRSEVDPSNSSGRLHALADTASMHPWIIPVLPDPTVTPGLPTVHLLTSSTSSNDTSYPMPPSRIRMIRHHEQVRLPPPRPPSSLYAPQPDPVEGNQRHPFGSEATTSGTVSETPDEIIPPSEPRSVLAIPATLPYSSTNDPLQPRDSSSRYTAPARYRHTLSRSHWFRTMRDRFDPLEPLSLDDRQGGGHSPYELFPTLDAFDYLVSPHREVSSAPRSPTRIRRRQSSDEPAVLVGGPAPNQRPFGFRRDPLVGLSGDHISPVSDIVAEERSNSAAQEDVNDSELRSSTAGRPSRGHMFTGSFWAGLFDEADSERDGSSRHASMYDRAFDDVRRGSMDSARTGSFRRPTSIFDDGVPHDVLRTTENDRNNPPQRSASVYNVFRGDSWRRQTDSERDGTRPLSSADMFRDDLRRGPSVWGSPRHSSSIIDGDRYPPTTSSSSSELPSLDRSTSRSLLDPRLRFGSGPASVNPRSSLLWASERDSALVRLRRRSRTTIHGLFDEEHVDEDHDRPDWQVPAPRDEPRSGDIQMPFSRFPATESLSRGQSMSSV